MKKLKTLVYKKLSTTGRVARKCSCSCRCGGKQLLPACRHLATWVKHPLEGRTQPHSNNLRYNTTTICRPFVYIFFSHCCRVDINQAYHIMSKRNFCFIRPEVFLNLPIFHSIRPRGQFPVSQWYQLTNVDHFEMGSKRGLGSCGPGQSNDWPPKRLTLPTSVHRVWHRFHDNWKVDQY